MDVILLVLIGILAFIAIVVMAVRARREPPGRRLPVFLSGVFLLALGLWTVASLFPLIPLLRDFDPLYGLYEVGEAARVLAAASFFGLLGILVARAIDRLSGAPPHD